MQVRLLIALLAIVADASPILVAPSNKTGTLKLLLYVPGGKVPPEDYLPSIQAAQGASHLRLAAVILRCHINLCDAILEVPKLMKDAIETANKSWGPFLKSDIVIAGHSLGGVGARHFFDTYPGTAGLALFGTQYNGDHEDFKGTLGYPVDLAKFPAALLALTGELDMVPTSHAAELVRQSKDLDEKDRFRKLPLIIAGMDHSQFCPPFEVAKDIKPEIPNADATMAIGAIVAAWIDHVMLGASDADSMLETMVKSTAQIAAPFISAMELDKTWCASAQKILAGGVQMTVSDEEKFSSRTLEHCHPSIDMRGVDAEATTCSYRYYSYTNSTIPDLFPTYQGADDIACKMISEDKIATVLKLPVPSMDSDEVKNRCRSINQQALAKAKELVRASWPKAMQRFDEQGKKITFTEDNQSFMGPQWVLTGLKVKEGANEITIEAPALISSITSKIFPGSHYCKLLAPSKAVEILMTTALTNRFGSSLNLIV